MLLQRAGDETGARRELHRANGIVATTGLTQFLPKSVIVGAVAGYIVQGVPRPQQRGEDGRRPLEPWHPCRRDHKANPHVCLKGVFASRDRDPDPGGRSAEQRGDRSAAEFVEGSVKWHLQGIYDKIGTRRRLVAVDRARRWVCFAEGARRWPGTFGRALVRAGHGSQLASLQGRRQHVHTTSGNFHHRPRIPHQHLRIVPRNDMVVARGQTCGSSGGPRDSRSHYRESETGDPARSSHRSARRPKPTQPALSRWTPAKPVARVYDPLRGARSAGSQFGVAVMKHDAIVKHPANHAHDILGLEWRAQQLVRHDRPVQ